MSITISEDIFIIILLNPNESKYADITTSGLSFVSIRIKTIDATQINSRDTNACVQGGSNAYKRDIRKHQITERITQLVDVEYLVAFLKT